MVGTGVDVPKLIASMEASVQDAVDQLAAAALCVAIYVTPFTTAAFTTKQGSMKAAKTASNQSGAKLDIRLVARLDAALKSLSVDQQVKRAKLGMTG